MTDGREQLSRELGEAYPRIHERGLEARLVAVLNDAYAFDVARGLLRVDAEAAADASEVLQAASWLASMVIRLPELERSDEVSAAIESLCPPSSEPKED